MSFFFGDNDTPSVTEDYQTCSRMLFTMKLSSHAKAKKKNIYMCVSALKKLGMVGWHNILFCQNILYRNCIFQYIFFPFFSRFDSLVTIHNKMFRVGAKI